MKILGKSPAPEQLAQFASLANYHNRKFQNLGGVAYRVGDISVREMLLGFWRRPKSVRPSLPIPSIRTDLRNTTFEQPTVIWFGHSSYLIKAGGLNLLVDPVFSGNASPIPGSVRAFAGANGYQVADLPPIDMLIITHDHYDHLDYATINQLRGRVQHVVLPLGVAAHFRHWGWDSKQLTELNWGDHTEPIPGVKLTATPAQHMSGRSLAPQQTLWASYVLDVAGVRLFIGGDSGYGSHFKAIGEQYGPFDLAILENGQYNELWQTIHTLPYETVLAALDLHARTLLPVHWAKFTLGYHPWNEPIKLLLPQADKCGLPVTVPRIGEPYAVGSPARREVWWDFT